MSITISKICISATLCIGLGTGCAAFRASVKETDPEQSEPLSAKYDQRDLLFLAEEMAKQIKSQPFQGNSGTKPLVAELGIQNRTKTHLDTKALADTLTTKLMDGSSVRFVNTSRRNELLREQGYQLANATEETRVKIGKQLGADYMLTGSLTEIEKESPRQARVSEKQDVFYQLTVEITDLETGVIALRKQVQRMRRASKPLIGW